jgi:hypothetical protein
MEHRRGALHDRLHGGGVGDVAGQRLDPGSSRPGPLALATSNSSSSLTFCCWPSASASVPCCRMRRASFLPRKPAPPVITTFMCVSIPFLCAASVHRTSATVYVGRACG